MSVTRSTSQAMSLLERYRAWLIAKGRFVAGKIAKREGTVHSRQVRETIDDNDWLDPGLRDHWLGAVFRCNYFEWTDEYLPYSDNERNIHERTIKVWRLKDPNVLPPDPGPPP